MFIRGSILTILYWLFIIIFISQIIYFQPFAVRSFLFDHENVNKIFPNPPYDKFTRCLLHAEKAFKNLSLQWFLVFGSALMYHRSNNFISDDIDIGIFYDDLLRKNLTAKNFTSTLKRFNFKLLVTYGQMNNGQGWTLKCPKSYVHFGIFVFYRINFKIRTKKPYRWWTASYNGLCSTMRYTKCRRGFSQIKLDKFQMYNKSFHVVSKQFLIDQYGLQWIIPKKYNYDQSIRVMPNLIDK